MEQALEKYTLQFSEVMSLIQKYVHAQEGSEQERISCNALKTYLNEQDMEFVKIIQVVLHIGRTKELDGTQSPAEIYHSIFHTFDVLKGWRTKEIEVKNMIIKVPLDTYLDKGLRILTSSQY